MGSREFDLLGESAFEDHMISRGYSFDKISVDLLHKENLYVERMALQQIEIVRYCNHKDINVLDWFIL